jgi:hypothetical protein
MINAVMIPGLVNPRDACYVDAFMQLLFHILPLRLLIVAWPNRDPIIFAVHLMFVAMSQDRLIDAVSLSTICEPDVFDGKDCFELGLHILGALRDASSRTLRDTIQQLFCAKHITRLSTSFYPFLLQTRFWSTFSLLTSSRFQILYLDCMLEFLPLSYSTWCWITLNTTKFH